MDFSYQNSIKMTEGNKKYKGQIIRQETITDKNGKQYVGRRKQQV